MIKLKQNLTLMVIPYEIYENRQRLIPKFHMKDPLFSLLISVITMLEQSSLNVSTSKFGSRKFTWRYQ